MKMNLLKLWGVAAGLLASATVRAAEPSDPTGILKKPIPDKLVVLTFDDGPASHYSVVTPILKQHGFGGSFYVCDFDSFRTRKDWYLTWRQMREMSQAGLEIGNHTSGHAGGAGIGPFLSMEDALIANGVPKPTTIAWPVYASNPATYPALAANGYIFGRGGYKRPYRPTVDNPFDIPGMEPKTVEEFVKTVRKAAGGRIVVLTYHGIPDIEHPPVTLDPGIFRAQMQYLKDNHYKVIAMRDLVEYIDPAKAAQLPPTSRDYKETGTELLAAEEKPAAIADSGVSRNPPPATPATPAPKTPAKLDLPEVSSPADGAPIVLEGDRALNVPKGPPIDLKSVLSGAGKLVKTGEGELRLADVQNTHGGTVIHGGTLTVRVAKNALGSGPVTIHEGATLQPANITGTNPLTIETGGAMHAADGFGSRWDADIILNGDATFSAYSSLELNTKSGGIRGPGGLTMAGNRGPWGKYVNEGRVVLSGRNTYTGRTVAQLGTLVIAKAAALYGADPVQWAADKIVVHKGATLLLKCGGPEEFDGESLGTLLQTIGRGPLTSGLTPGAVLCVDTGSAKVPVVLKTDIGSATELSGFDFRKAGEGTLVLAGKNTFSGRTHVERGMLSVESLNSVGQGKRSFSSLGAPSTDESGEIFLGQGNGTVPIGDGPCGLKYTGSGETSDRAINFAGRNSVITFEHAGTGLLKIAGPITISGYGADKLVVLSGDSSGIGELGGDLRDPHDRTGKAKTSLTKSGSGTWTLSGANTYSGPTLVKQGTLRISTPKSLGPGADIQISAGAKLALDFPGEIRVGKLTIEGKPQPPGRYSSADFGQAFTGKGSLVVQ